MRDFITFKSQSWSSMDKNVLSTQRNESKRISQTVTFETPEGEEVTKESLQYLWGQESMSHESMSPRVSAITQTKFRCGGERPMTVESNYVIAIATLSDWLKRLAPVFQPMTSKTKPNPTMYAWFLCVLGTVIGSWRCLFPLWLVGVIALVLVFRQSFENRSKVKANPNPKLLLYWQWVSLAHWLIDSFDSWNILSPRKTRFRFFRCGGESPVLGSAVTFSKG